MFRRAAAAPLVAVFAAAPRLRERGNSEPQDTSQWRGVEHLRSHSTAKYNQYSHGVVVRCEEPTERSRRDEAAKKLHCDPHRRVHDHYELQNATVGAGSFGVVMRAVHKATGVSRAMKKVHLSHTHEIDAIAHEVRMLHQVTPDPNIVSVVECFVEKEHVYLVREWCNGVDMCDWMDARMGKPVDERQIAALFATMVAAVQHCHECRVLHLDVKPENFVFDRERPKLIDFGLAESMDELSDRTAGTEEYHAPEINRHKSPALDSWSLGIILFALLTGGFMPNFTTSHELDVCSKKALRRCSPEACDLCKSLLIVKPEKRLTLDKALRHPFLQGETASSSSENVHKTIQDVRQQVNSLMASMTVVLNE